jgi:amino acid adenylation domain-containing protein/non-ribosomal peptide synthase protein (TIGR01720 family)
MLLSAKEFEESRQYWQEKLSGELDEIRLPCDGVSGGQRGEAEPEAGVTVKLGEELVSTLMKVSKGKPLARYVIMQAVLKVVMYKYTGRRDIVIASPVFNKQSTEYNTWLLLRDRVEPAEAFKEFLVRVKQTVSEAYRHQHYPYRRQLKNLEMDADISLFRVIMLMEGVHDTAFLAEVKGEQPIDQVVTAGTSTDGKTMEVRVQYNPGRFSEKLMLRFAERFRYVLEQVLEDLKTPINQLELAGEEEKRQMLERFNRSMRTSPPGGTIHELFEARVRKTPDAVALVETGGSVGENAAITYEELNRQSNRLARRLRERGTGAGTVVAIMAERTAAMVVGMLAILKAGAAYLPLDPVYPTDRVRYILEDSAAKQLLTQTGIWKEKAEVLEEIAGLEIMDLQDPENYRGDESNLQPENSGQHIYIVYTSGSTGRPKGVLVDHGGFVNLVNNHRHWFGDNAGTRMSWVAGIGFDAMAFDVWPALVGGAALYISDNETRMDAAAMKDWLIKNRIEITFQPTQMAERQLREQWPERGVALRVMRTAGDKLTVHPERPYPFTLYNLYGPTEDTVWTTIAEVPVQKEQQREPVIGIPLENKDVLVLGPDNQLQPVGVPGELVITGVGVAVGYLNRPELTVQKFSLQVGTPDMKENRTVDRNNIIRSYRTGDRGRWLTDGNLQFIGRRDQQVKIRGIRIELEEIEKRLLTYSGINEAVVTVTGETDKMLCAYIAAPALTVDREEKELKEYLARELPDYMIPPVIIRMQSLPLTPNGKVNRRALPKPELRRENRYAAPCSDTEIRLTAIWEEVLELGGDGALEKIGIDDNFFQVGGHSLRATQLVSLIHKEFNVRPTLMEIFGKPTIRQQAQVLQTAANTGDDGYKSIEPAPVKKTYPVSSAQKRLLVLQQMDPASTVYNLPVKYTVEGMLDGEKLQTLFQDLIMRHESLRTSFQMEDNRPVQRISEQSETIFTLETPPDDNIRRFIRPFDLTRAPLLRVAHVVEAPGRHRLLFDMHHIISDGQSNRRLVEDLMALYAEKELPPLRIQYKDYSEWLNSPRQKKRLKSREDYWLKLFDGEIPVLEIPTDHPRPRFPGNEGNTLYFRIDTEQTEDLKRLAAKEEATLHMILLAVVDVLLAKLSGQEDIVVGTPVAGRDHPDLEYIIGMFVNMLALRNRPENKLSFQQFLRQLKQTTLEAYDNQDYPFEDLVEKLDIDRESGRNSLFDVVLVTQAIDIPELEIPGLLLKPEKIENTTAKFDLNIQASEENGGIEMSIEYRTGLFREETVQRYITIIKKIIEEIVEEPRMAIGAIEIVTEAEKHRIQFEFNAPTAPYPKEKTIHGLFGEQAEKTPDNPAVKGENTLTYRELDSEAERWAAELIRKGVIPGTIVGVKMERTEKMIAALLGILKTGCAYMPIDPDYPQERVEYMLKDSAAVLIDDTVHIPDRDSAYQHPAVASSAPAYVIYTSGTTGKPKGALIEHRNVVSLMFHRGNRFDFNETDVWTQFHSTSFDFSVWEMYGALLYGGKLVMVPKMTARDPREFLKLLKEQKVSVLNQTPSAFYNLQEEELKKTNRELTLRYVIFGGEALSPGKLRKWIEKYPETRLINMYGITETTVHVTYKEIGKEEIETNISNIGRPLPTLQCYVKDPGNNHLPVGVVGELVVTGAGVCRGYLNRPQLTREIFGPEITGENNEPMRSYKTGDRARRLENGEMEYRGRVDRQVKIRGYRIELGEIQDRIIRHPDIKNAVVIAGEDRNGDKYLCAYVIIEKDAGPKPDDRELRGYCAAELPPHMVPAYFIAIGHVPLTANGKLDRRALPDPAEAISCEGEQYRAPVGTVEKELVEAWEKVLGRQGIGVTENFFTVGGDSIKAIQVTSRMSEKGYRLEIRDLFQYPSILELAPRVGKAKREPKQSEVTGEVPLTPIQKWFYEKQGLEPYVRHFNQAVMLLSPERLERETIQTILAKLQEHHDALRMTVTITGDTVKQENRGIGHPIFLWEREQGQKTKQEAQEELQEIAREIQRTIDLETGPLFKTLVYHMEDGDRLLLVAHHHIVDGVSWRILFEDFGTLYRRYRQGEPLELPKKTDSYKYWAEIQHRLAQTPEYIEEYRKRIPPVEDTEEEMIPRDREAGSNRVQDMAEEILQLDENETHLLLTRVNHAFGTEIDEILLSALARSVHETWGISGLTVAMEAHGREALTEDIDIGRTVGWFTAIYPVRLKVSDQWDCARQIKEIKEAHRRDRKNKIAYGIDRYLAAGPDDGGRPEPAIGFNYLGQFDEDIRRTGFELAVEPVGELMSLHIRRPYDFDVQGIIRDHRLTLAVTYSKVQYEKETVETWIRHLKHNLKEIIRFTSNRTNRELTPSDLTYTGITIEKLDQLTRQVRMQDIYPLSPLQEGILFHSLYDRDSAAYFEQIMLDVRGELEESLLQAAMKQLVKRHDILRTVFIPVEEGLEIPLQAVLEDREVEYVYRDLRQLPPGETTTDIISEYKARDRRRMFDLGRDPLMRLAVYREGETKYKFIWSHHHILMDGWCTGILHAELQDIYRGLREGKPHGLKPAAPYKNYIKWLQKQDKKVSGDYWHDYLEGYTNPVTLQGSKNDPGDGSDAMFIKGTVSTTFTEEESAGITEWAEKHRVTVNTVFRTIWGILLAKSNARLDVVFGTVVAGRPPEIEGVEMMVGLFINTIPVRINYEDGTTFEQLVTLVQASALQGEPHQHYPLAEIQSRHPLKQNLMDHIFTYQNYQTFEDIRRIENKTGGADRRGIFEIVGAEAYEQVNYNYNVLVIPGDRYVLSFEYNQMKYEQSIFQGLREQYREILHQVQENPRVIINDIKVTHELTSIRIENQEDAGEDFGF